MTTTSTINFLPLSANAISTDNGNPVQFQLTNNTKQNLFLYWMDRAGVEQQYGTITPGQTLTQATMSSHSWEVKSSDGSIGFKFYPAIAGQITVSGTSTPTFIDFSEKASIASNGQIWSTAEGYGLINVAKSLGIKDLGYTLSMNGQNNNLALNEISASSAWAAGITAKGVKVAVIDSGIASNPEVNANIIGGYDFYDHDSNPAPDSGSYQDHSLGVAAIIAGSHAPHAGQDTMGVAPDAQLLNVRVGSSTGASPQAMGDGIRWAVDNGAKVICMPLQNNAAGVDQSVIDAVHYAYTHNVVTVIIGGNFSNYGPTGPALIAQLNGEAIDVGNYDTGAATQMQSSNQPGTTPFNWVMAPSVGYTPNAAGGYTYHADGGTSFAGPYVAGLAALLFQQNPNATAAQIMQKIVAGASVSDSVATAALKGNNVIGTAGNDSFVATAAAEHVDGGAGIDTVAFHGASANYIITQNSDGSISVTDKVSVDGAAMLMNIERLSFTDTSIAYDVTGSAGQIFRLYEAVFNRTPDATGFGYWIKQADGGVSLNNIAASFVASDEFQQLFGAHPSSQQLAAAMYHNVLHRDGSAAEVASWAYTLDHGMSVAQMLTGFSESAENIANLVGIQSHGMNYTPFVG